MAESLVTDVRELELADFPDLAALDSDLGRALWVLYVLRKGLGVETASAHEVSVVLRDIGRVSVSRQKVASILSSDRTLAAPRKIRGKQRFQIMRDGIGLIEASGPGVLYVDPSSALTVVRQVQELMAGLEGPIRICDPYLDPRSLDFLPHMTRATELRILTDQVRKKDTLVRDLKPLTLELGVPIEVRRAPERTLHDRYVIDNTEMILFGTSFNGLGLKQSFVVSVGQDLRSVALKAFDSLWSSSVPL